MSAVESFATDTNVGGNEELTMEKLTIAIIGFLVSFGAMWFILGMAYEKASRMNKEDDDGWY